MSSSTHVSVTIQTSSEPVPAVPAWFGEVAVTAHALRHLGVLATIEERVVVLQKIWEGCEGREGSPSCTA